MVREFEGIWIPRRIWLSKEITMQEKVFLAEIKSLDGKEGCYASNQYFADFFGISKRRVSEVINGLVSKKLITSTMVYKENSKQVERRVLHISAMGYGNFSQGGIEETCYDITKINNKDNKEYKESAIENIYKAYPIKCVVRKVPTGKSKKDKEKIRSLLKTKKYTETEMIGIIKTYTDECRKGKVYMKNFSTFLNNIPDYSTEEVAKAEDKPLLLGDYDIPRNDFTMYTNNILTEKCKEGKYKFKNQVV